MMLPHIKSVTCSGHPAPCQNHRRCTVKTIITSKSSYGQAKHHNKAKAESNKHLYFLQSCSWNADGKVLLICELTYTDGSRARIPMTGGLDIGDWHNLKPLPNARIGVSFWTPEKVRIGFYCTRQVNPHPEKTLLSAKLISTGVSVPLIGAITLEE